MLILYLEILLNLIISSRIFCIYFDILCKQPTNREFHFFFNEVKLLYNITLVLGVKHQFSSVQSFSCVQLFATPRTTTCQASLYMTNSQSLLKLMFIQSVMPSNHLILSSPCPPAFNLSQHQGFFQ